MDDPSSFKNIVMMMIFNLNSYEQIIIYPPPNGQAKVVNLDALKKHVNDLKI